jgi:pimeloyl-ACP methyl ester carboxylesterase
VITVPTIVLHGESDGVSPPQSSERAQPLFCWPLSATGSARCWTLPSP